MSPSRAREPLGPLELDVLRFVAERHPVGVAEVARHFVESSGHARTTILTVMERLRKKRYLRRRKSDGRHQYSPTVEHGDLLGRLVGEFVENVLGGSVSPFVAYLVDQEKLTEAEAGKLLRMLERIEDKEQDSP